MRPDELDPVTDLLTEAFLDDPVLSWAFHDRSARPAALRLVLGSFLRGGQVRRLETGGRLRAVAVWTGSADAAVPMPAEPPAVLVPYLDRLAELDRLLTERIPADTEHRFLKVIGVRPADHGQGHGAALLRQGLAECDEAGLPAYLEASSSRNAALYARHGFRPHGAAIRLPDGPSLTPMWRDPNPTMITHRTEQYS